MADSNSSLTPEQQLLNLIESSGGGTPSTTAAKPSEDKTSKRVVVDLSSIFSISALKGRISYAQETITNIFKGKVETFQLGHVNRFLKRFIIVLTGTLSVILVYETQWVYWGFGAQFDVAQKEMVDIPLAQIYTINASNLEELNIKSIFTPTDKRAVPVAEIKETVSANLNEMIKDLKLTGISINPADPKRTFCMIEDIKRNVTSFLKVGDTISGLEIKEISSDVILLASGNETIELR